jgi:hypothetical protein
MRGPGMRLGLDVRRLWRCPQCAAERKLPADVTSVRCSACSNAPFMQIVEPPRHPRPTPKPLNPFLTIDPDTPDPDDPRSTSASPAPAEGVVETTSAPDSVLPAPPHSTNAPSHKREDRRNKPRHQRDRQGKPNRPPQSNVPAPPADSPPAAMSTPESIPEPPAPSPPVGPESSPETNPPAG